MRKCVLMLPVICLLMAADKPNPDAKKELKKFEGTWLPVSMEANGDPVPAEAAKGLKVTIKGDKITIVHGKRSSKATFTIDPSKKPKWLDATGKEQGKEVKTIGIYEFDGAKLKICYTLAGGKRPKEFKTEGGTEKAPIVLSVYKKAEGD